MHRTKRGRPSPAIIVAVLALVAALGGTAVAEQATTSVSKKKTKKIAKRVANKAVDNALPIGSGELGTIVERNDETTIPVNTNGTAEVDCNTDETVISGGWRDNAPPTGANLAVVYEDHRTSNGWRASARAFGTARTIRVFAYCLQP